MNVLGTDLQLFHAVRLLLRGLNRRRPVARPAREEGLGVAVGADLRRAHLHARSSCRAQGFQLRRLLCIRLGGDGDSPTRKRVLPIRFAALLILHTNEDAVPVGIFLRAKGGGGVCRRRRRNDARRKSAGLGAHVGAVVRSERQRTRRRERVALRELHRHAARLTRKCRDAIAGKSDAARCRLRNTLQGRCVHRLCRTRHGERQIRVCRERTVFDAHGLYAVMGGVADEDVCPIAGGCRNADDLHLARCGVARRARDGLAVHLCAGEDEIVPAAHVQLAVGGIDSKPRCRALIDLQLRSAVLDGVELDCMRTERTARCDGLHVRPVAHNAGSARYHRTADACLHGILADVITALRADIEFACARFPVAAACCDEDVRLLCACGGLCIRARRGLFRKHLRALFFIGRDVGQSLLGTVLCICVHRRRLVRIYFCVDALLLSVRAFLHRVGFLHLRADVHHHDIEPHGRNPRRAVRRKLLDVLAVMRRDVCRLACVEMASLYNALDGRLEVVDGDADACTHDTRSTCAALLVKVYIVLCCDGNLLGGSLLLGIRIICFRVSERAVRDRRLNGILYIAAADARPDAGNACGADAEYIVVQMLRVLRMDERLPLIVRVDDLRMVGDVRLGRAAVKEDGRADTHGAPVACSTERLGKCIEVCRIVRRDRKPARIHRAVLKCGARALLHAHEIVRVRETKFVGEADPRRERGDSLRGARRDGGILCRDRAARRLCLSRAIDEIDARPRTKRSALPCDGDGADECAAVRRVVRAHGYICPVRLCRRIRNLRRGRAADDIRIDCSNHRYARPCTTAVGDEGVRCMCRRGGDGDAAIRIVFAALRQTIQTAECTECIDGQRPIVEFPVIQPVLDPGCGIRMLRMGNNLSAGA